MTWDGAGSIHAVRLRVTRLQASGAPVIGANASYVTNALTKLTFTPEFSEGEEIEEKNGAGELCLYYKAPDTLKAVTVGLEVCTPDPALEELLTGGDLLLESTTHVGYAAPAIGSDPNPNGVSIEAWSRAVIGGAPAATNPYIHWVFGRVRLRADERALENAGMKPAFTGTGSENVSWGDGPAGDWDHDSDRLWQWARTATIPTSQFGYRAVAA